MPDWVVPLVVLVMVLAVGAAVLYIKREAERYRKEVMEKGSPFVAHVVMAHNDLCKTGDSYGASARVLVTFEPEPAAVHDALAAAAARLLELREREPATDAERQAAPLATDESFRPGRVPVPPELTGGRAVYSFDLYIERALLPSKVLDHPYVHLMAVPGDKGLMCMIPYPDAK